MAENIYKKLQNARVKIKNTSLKKSGEAKDYNGNVRYSYFELGDFLPAKIEIFNELGLCDFITFDIDQELLNSHIINQSKFVGDAKLTIVNTDTPDEKIVFSSPFPELDETKMSNAIQLLGGVQTYMRRYLYMLALDIVENDLIEKTAQDDAEEKPTTKPSKKTDASKATNPTTSSAAQDFDKMVRDKIKEIAVKNLPIKNSLVEFIKNEVGIGLKDIGTTSSENLQKINSFIESYPTTTTA